MIRFKTKGQTASNPESMFSCESIRAIMENPFFAGLVACYERPELDMEDDPENPEKRVRKWRRINTRRMIEIQPERPSDRARRSAQQHASTGSFRPAIH